RCPRPGSSCPRTSDYSQTWTRSGCHTADRAAPAALRICCADSLLASLGCRRTTCRLGPLGTVLGPALPPVVDTRRVQRGADDVIPDDRQVLHPAATDQHDRVLLKVVPFAGNVGRDLEPIGQ